MRYHHAPGVTLHDERPPFFVTPEGGAVVTDAPLAMLWRAAHRSDLTDLLATFANDRALGDLVPEALACLAVAGLLERDRVPMPLASAAADASDHAARGPLVASIVVVSSPRELEFLDDCLSSVAAARYEPLEAIVVDNDCRAPLEPVVRRHLPRATIVSPPARLRLAQACNMAIASSRASYALLMNPDVKLHRDALGYLVARAQRDDRTAAVVPKTRFWKTPAFLNAIGNRVPRTGWGTDNAIGQLDLGQFDGWCEPPSASLTVELLSRAAWEAVGPFDEKFPAYYEDAEWAYRARLMGWRIHAATRAEAFHVFGGFWDAAEDGGLTPRKLETAVIGRLRFVVRIAGTATLLACLKSYIWEDGHNTLASWRRGDRNTLAAYRSAWSTVIRQVPSLVAERRKLQRQRLVPDAALFPPDGSMPLSYTWRNAPVLTSSIVRRAYVPLLRGGAAKLVPESATAR